MADNNNVTKEELDALLGGEADTGVTQREDAEERDGAGGSITVKRLLHAVQALHARVELLEDQVRELRLQAISGQLQSQDKRPVPQSKPAPKPSAPAPRAEPQLSRLERYGRGRS
ncbi:hypothetical protein [Paenibacillus sp. 1P07SE]|uniref:hypothetical protein n=1 Tax=Paenibacillus sp. 1P07SE TaxID=3132209 RepID=UPI0039A458D2